MEQQFKYKLAISILTRNRSAFVRELLRKMAKILHERNVGLYLFDGSDKNMLEPIVERYRKSGYDNIHHYYYDPAKYDGESRYINLSRAIALNTKVNAEYRWMCSDKFFPDEIGLDQVIAQLDKNYDVIVYNTLYRNEDKTKKYIEKAEFLRECTVKLQILAAPVIRYSIAEQYTDYNLKKTAKDNLYSEIYLIWKGIFDAKEFSALLLCRDNRYIQKILPLCNHEISGHVKRADTMYFFVEEVCNTIAEFPEIHNNEKKTIMKSISRYTWLSLEGFALLRSYKGYNINQCFQYLNRLKHVTDVPVPIIMGISLLPPSEARILHRLICRKKQSKGLQVFR